MKLKWSNIMPPIKLERKNYSDYKINLNTLRPITYWKVPKKLQTLINTVYNEYSHNNTANCFICNKTFANSFLRDFHLINLHNFATCYSCSDCTSKGVINDEENTFLSVQSYFNQLVDIHDVNNVKTR